MASLSQLLADPSLGLRLVQAAPDDPQLSWVSTTELLDLARYLEGGEIVLTTGLALGGEDPRWRDFVAGLGRARVAAIGFGIGVNHERIPRPLVAAASDYRVALFEVPPPTPFIAVSKAVSALLRADEMRAAHQALQTHERLIEGARSSTDSASVLASIAQATGRQLALRGSDGSIVASTAGFTTAGRGRPDSPDAEIVPLDEDGAAQLLVSSGPPLGPEARAVVAAGAMVLGLHLRGERLEDERELQRWSRLSFALLNGELDPRTVSLLDPSLDLPAQLRAIAVQGASEQVGGWVRAARSGMDRLVTAGAPQGGGLSLAWQLCPVDDRSLEAALARAAAHDLDAVVGRAARVDRLPLSRNSATALLGSLSRRAALYASPRVPTVLRAEGEAPLLDALLSIAGGAISPGRASGASAAALSAAVLGPLSAHSARAGGSASAVRGDGPLDTGLDAAPDTGLDAEERETLRETLRCLLEHHGQRTPTAAALGVHRNTLRDRVRRIERCTGRIFDDPDARAELWLALRLEQQGPRA